MSSNSMIAMTQAGLTGRGSYAQSYGELVKFSLDDDGQPFPNPDKGRIADKPGVSPTWLLYGRFEGSSPKKTDIYLSECR